MFESGCPVNIVQLLCFVDHSFDVGTLQKCGFADDFLPSLLFLSEIVVCYMSDGFKTAWKNHITLLISFADTSEPIEYLLIVKIFIGEFKWNLLNFEFVKATLLILHLLIGDIFSEEYHLVFCSSCNYSRETLLLWMYLGMSSARPFCLRFLL